jgi:hypothetical protein
MKKVNSRDFQKRFGQIADDLKEGQAIHVTKHGKVLGKFTKAPTRRIKTPDFLKELQTHSYSKELGSQILKEFHDSLS